MPIAVVILALVVAGAAIGASFVLGGPVFAIPVVIGALLGWLLVTLMRRTLGREPLESERRQEPIEFTDEDRETLLPSATPEERAQNRRRAAERR